MANSPTPASPRDVAGDADLLEEIRERFDAASDEWRAIRDEGDTDMRYVAGDGWKPEDRRAREKAGRPCLWLDELGQYFNQIINDVRANPIGMKFDPTGPQTTDKGAAFYEDKAREIEYRSHAQIAYTTAFENAVQRSFGWVRVTTRFESESSPNQELWIEDVPDPNSIVPDPDFKRPDFSDGKYLFALQTFTQTEFRRRWPTATITDFTGDVAKVAPRWIRDNKIQVAEYWTIEAQPRTLSSYRTPDQQVIHAHDEDVAQIPAGAVKLKTIRRVQIPAVKQYITNGVEILERHEWPGKYIPFAACFGKVLYVDDGGGTRRKILSLTRLARDPSMLYAYYRTAQAEVVGRTTKNAAIGYEGQFRGHETDWEKSVHEPMAFLQAKPTAEGLPAGTVLPLPTFNNWEPPIQALEMGAEGARRAIQAAMGVSPLPTDAQRINQKSGVALARISDSGQKGSFHFKDHYGDMIRHVGVMVEDLIDKVYDSPRAVGVRKADQTTASVPINDPQNPEAVDTRGRYLVTVSTGPSTDSVREAASDFADQLANNPQIFPMIADLVVKLKDLGPLGDEIADRLTPPQYRQKPGQPPDPAQLQQQLQQVTMELQKAQQIIATESAKEQVRQQGQMQVEQARAQSATALQLKLKEMDNACKIAVARISAAKGALDTAAEVEEERLSTGLQLAHEEREAAKDRAHEVAKGAMDHAHTLIEAEQVHGHAIEQGAQAGAIASQQQADAAALQATAPQDGDSGTGGAS